MKTILSRWRTRIHPGGLLQGTDEGPVGQRSQSLPGSPLQARSEWRVLRPPVGMGESLELERRSSLAQEALVTGRPPKSKALRMCQAGMVAV